LKILLTNDDGIHAEGLTALESIARALSDDVWIVAPEVEQSGASRALTLSMPLRVRRLDDRRFAVDGTPTDCVMIAVQDLVDGKPDLVLSGVNRGQNLAEDVSMSGTVAGAIEGMVMGVPSIALSQAMRIFHDDERAPYETAITHAPGIIERLLEIGWPNDAVINLNFPCCAPDQVTEVEVTHQGFRGFNGSHAEKRTDLRGRDYYWMGFRNQEVAPPSGTDLAAIANNRISVTPLHIDLTHTRSLGELRGRLGGAIPKLARKP
jgi:5'-nucleotidase